jgi:hypothetical protein
MIAKCKRHGEQRVVKVEDYPKSVKLILTCGCYEVIRK